MEKLFQPKESYINILFPFFIFFMIWTEYKIFTILSVVFDLDKT